jgi:hypothetical protein
MPHYVGLDVSQKTTTICVVDEQGRPMPHSRRPYSARGSVGLGGTRALLGDSVNGRCVELRAPGRAGRLEPGAIKSILSRLGRATAGLLDLTGF